MRAILIITLLAIAQLGLQAQAQVSLKDIHELLQTNSYVSQSNSNMLALADEQYSFFKSQLKPSITLGAEIPNYQKTSAAITQPDGTIAFQSISQSNAFIGLNVQQVITATGATVFASSGLSRFDDYSQSFNSYNGMPIRLGIVQPIFGFNRWKYDKDIASLQHQEAQRQYDLDTEQSMMDATRLYFDILVAEENLKIAQTNLSANQKLIAIADERLKLGKISKDEKLQLDIELNQAELSSTQAAYVRQNAVQALYTFLSMDTPDNDMVFEVPAVSAMNIDIAQLQNSSIAFRPENIAMMRTIAEARSELDRVSTEFGPKISVSATYGLARGSDQISEIYTDPLDQQSANVSVSIPILDWGRKKSAQNQARIKRQEAEASLAQTQLEVANNVEQLAMRMLNLQDEVSILKNIMDKAQQRYEISNERYVLGDISIMHLTIAQREKDQTQRNYINGLRQYWLTYHQIKTLTGVDIIQ